MNTQSARRNPTVLGALGYLVSNLAAGITSFVLLVTLFAVGISTAIIWVGIPLVALAIVLCRGGAQLERARVRAMLGTTISSPYRALPTDVRQRWRARARDGATWRDLTYLLLLLPAGVIEFSLMVTFWATSLGLLFLPVYFRYLPSGEWRLFDWDHPWLVVDTTWEALPWALLGALLLAVTIPMTRGLGRAHSRFAAAMLGARR